MGQTYLAIDLIFVVNFYGIILQRINKRRKDLQLTHAGQCHVPQSKRLNDCPRRAHI